MADEAEAMSSRVLEDSTTILEDEGVTSSGLATGQQNAVSGTRSRSIKKKKTSGSFSSVPRRSRHASTSSKASSRRQSLVPAVSLSEWQETMSKYMRSKNLKPNKVYQAFDPFHRGFVQKQDIKPGLKNLTSFPYTADEVKSIFSQLHHKDRLFSREEFLEHTKKKTSVASSADKAHTKYVRLCNEYLYLRAKDGHPEKPAAFIKSVFGSVSVNAETLSKGMAKVKTRGIVLSAAELSHLKKYFFAQEPYVSPEALSKGIVLKPEMEIDDTSPVAVAFAAKLAKRAKPAESEPEVQVELTPERTYLL